jgi:hypothetical protein
MPRANQPNTAPVKATAKNQLVSRTVRVREARPSHSSQGTSATQQNGAKRASMRAQSASTATLATAAAIGERRTAFALSGRRPAALRLAN